jgi:hypothetical protein
MNFFSRISSRYLLLSLAVATPIVTAQPAVHTIEYDTDETIIYGERFGQGPKVMMFDNFEHGDKFAKQFANTSSSWSNQVTLSKEADGNSAHRAADDTGRIQQIRNVFDGDYRQALVAYSVKVPHGTTFPAESKPKTFSESSAWKFAWLMSGTDGHSKANLFDVCLPQYSGGGIMSLSGNDGVVDWIEKPATWWSWDGYNHMTSYISIDSSLLSTMPMEYRFSVVNNRTLYEKEGLALEGRFRQTNHTFDRVNIPGWFRNTENANFQGLYDNLYVAVGDNALARVVITDNKIYAQSRFAIPVAPKSWTENKIILDNDVLPTQQEYYVHIFDKDGKRSPKSLRICPKCPKMLIQ